MNIPETGGKIKRFLQDSVEGNRGFYLGLAMGVGILGFGLGRLSVDVAAPAPVIIEKPGVSVQKPAGEPSEGIVASSTIPASVNKPALAGQAASAISSQKADAPVPSTGAGEGTYVASKKSDKYHLPWCSGAKRISEENKIWFSTKEEAEKAGYAPAGNCPGI